MKLRISFKSPDAVYYAVAGEVADLEPTTPAELDELEEYDGDLGQWRSWRAKQLTDALERWVRYGEVVTVEFDTEASTAKVVEVY